MVWQNILLTNHIMAHVDKTFCQPITGFNPGVLATKLPIMEQTIVFHHDRIWEDLVHLVPDPDPCAANIVQLNVLLFRQLCRFLHRSKFKSLISNLWSDLYDILVQHALHNMSCIYIYIYNFWTCDHPLGLAFRGWFFRSLSAEVLEDWTTNYHAQSLEAGSIDDNDDHDK